MRRTLSGDIDPDDLLIIAAGAVREADREARGIPEGPPRVANLRAPVTPREQRMAAEHERRQDRLHGVDRAADAERVLLDHLRRVYGESPESAAINRKSPTAYQRLYFPDRVNP